MNENFYSLFTLACICFVLYLALGFEYLDDKKRRRKMKANLLNLVSEALSAFVEMTSVAEDLANMEAIDLVGRSTEDKVGEETHFERIALAKRRGASALDKLRYMLEMKEVE